MGRGDEKIRRVEGWRKRRRWERKGEERSIVGGRVEVKGGKERSERRRRRRKREREVKKENREGGEGGKQRR